MVRRNVTKPSASSSIGVKKPVRTWMKKNGKKVGGWFVAAAVAGLAYGGLKELAGRRIAANKVPLAQERTTIANIYGLNTNKASDLKVLNFIDSIANKENISRGRVLQTLEKNSLADSQIWAIDNKLKTEKNPAERERLKRIQRILISAQNKEVKAKLDEMVSQKGTLKQVEAKLR